MAEAKQNKPNDDTQGQTPPVVPTFKGTPAWNVHYRDPKSGASMPSFKLDGDTMPKVGDKIIVANGKTTQTGVVKHVFNGNSVAITAIEKETK